MKCARLKRKIRVSKLLLPLRKFHNNENGNYSTTISAPTHTLISPNQNCQRDVEFPALSSPIYSLRQMRDRHTAKVKRITWWKKRDERVTEKLFQKSMKCVVRTFPPKSNGVVCFRWCFHYTERRKCNPLIRSISIKTSSNFSPKMFILLMFLCLSQNSTLW